MKDLWPIQQAVYAALTEAPATYPVYDAAPQGATAPYIVIGEFLAEQDDDLSEDSTDATLTLHGWSRTAGKQQAHAILAFIRARLDKQTIGGAWACYEEQHEVFEDRSSTAASRLYHGVCRFRIRLN